MMSQREQLNWIHILLADFPYIYNIFLFLQANDMEQLIGGSVYFGLHFEGITSIMEPGRGGARL